MKPIETQKPSAVDRVMEQHVEADCPAVEKAIRAEDLMTADELFTSCTVVRVLPIGRFENQTMEKAPGPISSRLIKVIDGIIAGRDERFKERLQPL